MSELDDLLARVAELEADRDELREKYEPDGLISTARKVLEERGRADSAEARARVQAEQIAALQEAVRQIVKTPYRDWHLNARIAREALALAEGCAAPADEETP